ncbi:hypothetical protein DES45_1162 [Microvirga subterranea]|uniref:Uncharacterized protein n=2 Tax=Microvirga subterranea TaxID=186651 RepID=A0A370HC51_9HYPH|nr:hypothetical protein DES45_1162 [Microvirga subterranea]
MGRLLIALGALAAGALLVPGDAAAQRGFRGGFPGGGVGIGRIGGMGGIGGIGRVGGFGGFRGIGAPMGGFRAGTIGGFRPGPAYGWRTAELVSPGFGAAAIARPGIGYRPAIGAYGWRGPGYRPYPYYRGAYGWRYPYYGYYRRGWGYPYYYGGALAAGLAIGALSYPYNYGYPYDYSYPYYGATYGGDCYLVRRRVVDQWGRVFIRRVQVCDY